MTIPHKPKRVTYVVRTDGKTMGKGVFVTTSMYEAVREIENKLRGTDLNQVDIKLSVKNGRAID